MMNPATHMTLTSPSQTPCPLIGLQVSRSDLRNVATHTYLARTLIEGISYTMIVIMAIEYAVMHTGKGGRPVIGAGPS